MLFRSGAATGLAALVAHAIDRAIAPTGAWSSIVTVVVAVGVGMAVAIGGAAVLRVHEIAQRWGFCHAGKFAAAYQQRFGQSPTDTRRQRR